MKIALTSVVARLDAEENFVALDMRRHDRDLALGSRTGKASLVGR